MYIYNNTAKYIQYYNVYVRGYKHEYIVVYIFKSYKMTINIVGERERERKREREREGLHKF
jgi:hypothetical protein